MQPMDYAPNRRVSHAERRADLFEGLSALLVGRPDMQDVGIRQLGLRVLGAGWVAAGRSAFL